MYFSPEDWARTSEIYEKWWARDLKRPLLVAERHNKTIPQISKGNCNDFNKSAEEVINEMDYNIRNTDYFGDAFPMAHWEFFGPGCLAAFIGAPVKIESDNVWFYPVLGEDKELSELHVEYKKGNPWLERCKDLYNAAVKKWNGKVLIGTTDIGGELDVLASLVGSERLLYELIDEPEEVDRLCKEVHEVWLKVYNELNEIIAPANPGYADWTNLFSKKPYYTQQCDFSYMISPDMFARFVEPYLRKTGELLGHSMYHTDGKGELPHLDILLAIDSFEAIQWQPGDGAGYGYKWIDVYKKVLSKGKYMQFIGSNSDFEEVTNEVGARGFFFTTGFEDEKTMREFFAKYQTENEEKYR